MTPRRTALFVALLLGTGALVTAVNPQRAARPPASSAPAPPPPPPAPASPRRTLEVAFDTRRVVRRTVPVGSRAIVQVRVDRPGDVEVPTLGLFATASPGADASFDLWAERPGRHRVTFTPAGGARRRIGSLVLQR